MNCDHGWGGDARDVGRMITLYQFGNSVCCQKVRITLSEKGLAWSTVEVNLFRNEQYRPEYLKLNPKGVVPTLIHDDSAIIESTLICEYLDDTFPSPPLVPKDPLQRTRMRLWSKMVDEGLHEGVSEISFSAMFRERMKSMPAEAREQRFQNVGDPRRRDRFRSTFELGVQSPFVLHGAAAFDKAFRRLESALQEEGPWILGADPTLADINMMPYVARLDFLGLLDLWTAKLPLTQAWWKKVNAWPSYQAGIVAPLSRAEYDEMQTHGPRIRNELAALLDQLHQIRVTEPAATVTGER
jgi:glutathione S-transferase